MLKDLRNWIDDLSSPGRLLTATWGIIAAMMIIGMFWVQNSHTRVMYEGGTLVIFYRTHGIHPLDLVFLALLLALAGVLHMILSHGFSRTDTPQNEK